MPSRGNILPKEREEKSTDTDISAFKPSKVLDIMFALCVDHSGSTEENVIYLLAAAEKSRKKVS